uniref:Nuclear receptor domain-containing protein n=1 Tax=Ditylenchus dipsaci TaxID=166011 RepID=A0A915EIR6_9BILA
MMSSSANKNIQKSPYSCCLVCGQPTSCLHYDIASCFGCKSSFRRIIISRKRLFCSNKFISNLAHVARCQACRFDRCILMGMNPLAVQLPENIDPNEIVVELAQRKTFLLDKFKHELSTLEKVFPPPKEILESRELKSLLQIESKIKKIRETSNFPKALMENYTICELIQSSHNELAYADKHVVSFLANKGASSHGVVVILKKTQNSIQ